MSNGFTTRCQPAFCCPNPVLTLGFPQAGRTANTVVLANGAVVDLNVLGAIVQQFCPGVLEAAAAQAAAVTTPAAAATTATTPATTTTGTTLDTALTNLATQSAMAQMAAQVEFRNAMDLRDGPGLDQMALARMMMGM